MILKNTNTKLAELNILESEEIKESDFDRNNELMYKKNDNYYKIKNDKTDMEILIALKLKEIEYIKTIKDMSVFLIVIVIIGIFVLRP